MPSTVTITTRNQTTPDALATMTTTLPTFGPALTRRDIAEIGDGTGAYILNLYVPTLLLLPVGRLGKLSIAPGQYHYFGSAYGPGGIRARVARHMRTANKRPHWHIDHLAQAVGVQSAHVFPGGNECDLIAHFSREHSLSTPFAGFGSSDCVFCDAHLLAQKQHHPTLAS